MVTVALTGLHRRLAACVLALSSLGVAAAESAPLTLKDWFEPALVDDMVLSPDGRKVAGLGGIGTSLVFLLDLETSKTSVVSRSAPYSRTYPYEVAWITNELLAIDYSNGKAFAVDLQGKKVDGLNAAFVRRLPAKAPGDIRVLTAPMRGEGVDIVNLATGERIKQRVSLPGEPLRYGFDDDGVLRLVMTKESGAWTERTVLRNYYRADEHSEWELLAEGSIHDELWTPVRVLPEAHQIVVYSRRDRDTFALFRYDTQKKQIVDLMAGHPSEDFAFGSYGQDGFFRRVITSGIKPSTHWFDARWSALQDAVDKALPERINSLSGDAQNRVLVASRSDVDPGRWYVLDTKTGKLREIGEVRPRIDPQRMRPMEALQYPARDGLQVHAYLTRPQQAAPSPAPTVVFIHGGPHVRDVWGWDPEVQLLAAQGYAVFQPQFRGSTGFGKRYERAGHRQWGRAMSDDITDGVEWLVQHKIADPARICIYGASYGGYAALWGVIKTPGLYRCGVSLAGVSDLTAAAAHSWLDDSDATSREFDRMTLGDADRDRALLDEVSPVRHADKVKVQLLLAHGELDQRVLFSQSKRMVAALKDLGKPVEWLPLEREGHGLFWTESKLLYYRTLLTFLHRHIGGPDTLPPPADKQDSAAK
jgi:dipeptidyl aminopeptidase/acylaminoacyl peptidase